MSDLSVVIVSHNSRAELEQCLPAVITGEHEVIVVDNGSHDGADDLLARRFPDVHFVALAENRGYGSAANEGLRVSNTPLVLVLNPDAWPCEDGLERLVACAWRRPRAGVIAPQLHDANGIPQQTLLGLPTPWWAGRPAVSSGPAPRRARSPRGNRFAVGAALLLRREALDQVGPFDPAFFMFYEEVDLCWRLQRAGWSVELCPDAAFVHLGGTATHRDWPRMYREQLRGHLRFLTKRDGTATAERARGYLAWVLFVRALAGSGEARRAYGEAATWLRSSSLERLLANPDRTP